MDFQNKVHTKMKAYIHKVIAINPTSTIFSIYDIYDMSIMVSVYTIDIS